MGFDHSLTEGIVSVVGVTSATNGNGIGLAVDVKHVRALLAAPRTTPKALARGPQVGDPRHDGVVAYSPYAEIGSTSTNDHMAKSASWACPSTTVPSTEAARTLVRT